VFTKTVRRSSLRNQIYFPLIPLRLSEISHGTLSSLRSRRSSAFDILFSATSRPERPKLSNDHAHRPPRRSKPARKSGPLTRSTLSACAGGSPYTASSASHRRSQNIFDP